MKILVGSYSEMQSYITQIRYDVFVVEQGISFEEEFDTLDHTCRHLVLFIDDLAVATARVIPNEFRIGRLAVVASHRHLGLGSKVVLAAEKVILELGGTTSSLNAQVSAMAFYGKLGYQAAGDKFVEASIDHQHMTKKL